MLSARVRYGFVVALAYAAALGACSDDDESDAAAPVADAGKPPPRRDARPSPSSSSGFDPEEEDEPLDAAADAADDAPVDAPPPSFQGVISPLSDELRARMTNVTWREGCPVGLNELSLIEVSYIDFAGAHREGQMIVASRVAPSVVEVFRQIYAARFPIAKMVLVEEYDGDDDRSMADNNSSAFNCRRVTGGTSYSQHSYGTSIDINPVQNPYLRNSVLQPPASVPYKNRDDVRTGMIVAGSAPLVAFDALGWGWGGRFSSLKDYMHFSENGL